VERGAWSVEYAMKRSGMIFGCSDFLGCVSLWSPNVSQPHVKMLCHRGAITDIAVDRSGQYVLLVLRLTKISIMVTTGLDCKLKVFDVRTFKRLRSYDTPNRKTIQSLDISQKSTLAIGFGSHVQVNISPSPMNSSGLEGLHRQTNYRAVPNSSFAQPKQNISCSLLSF
jgi:WD40 repeat protein